MLAKLNACLQKQNPTNGKEAQAALPSVCRGSSEDLFFGMSAESETPTPLPEVPVSKMATRAAIESKSISLFPAIAAIEPTAQVNSAVLNSLGTGLAPGINYIDATTAAERAAWIGAYVAGIKSADPGLWCTLTQPATVTGPDIEAARKTQVARALRGLLAAIEKAPVEEKSATLLFIAGAS